MNQKTLLEIKNLTLCFTNAGQSFPVLRRIDLSLQEGEKLGIVGESGCGKSVLVKALLRLLPAHSSFISEGEILYQKKDLLKLSENEMQKIRGKEIGMIPQDPMTSLNPTLKIGYQISEGFLRHYPQATKEEVKERVLNLLHLVGIPDPERRMGEYPHTQSGGIRQRALIAMALAAEPKILIADEPTTALDVTVQAQILDVMRAIQKDKSIILITHDLSVAASFCDRIIVMYAGKIVEDAPSFELFSNPKHPYTIRLLQSIPRLDLPHDTPLQPIPGSPPDIKTICEGCAFTPRCTEAMNICRKQTPPLYVVKNQHAAACFLYNPQRGVK